MKRLILSLLFLLLVAQAEAANNTYWISRSGDDKNACVISATKPAAGSMRKSFQEGIKCLSSGDILKVEAGIYTEIQGTTSADGQAGTRNVLRGVNIPDGTAAAKTRILCETITVASTKVHPVCEIRPASGIVHVLWFTDSTDNLSHFIIDSFRINNVDSLPTIKRFIRVTGSRCDNCEFRNISMVNLGSMPEGSDPISFSSNTAHCDNTVFDGLWIDNWEKATPTSEGTNGIYAHCNNIVIRRSRFENIYARAIQYYSSGDVPFTGGLIEDNYIENMGNSGILVGFTGNGAVVRRNVIKNPGLLGGGVGFSNSDGIILSAPNSVAYNNVVVGASGRGICGGSEPNCGGTSRIIRNNILLGNASAILSTGTVSNNITSGVQADIFQDTANDNYCLKPGASTAINSGFAVPGMAFNGVADIGACETVPTTGFTAVSTDSNIQITFPINTQVPLSPAGGITGFTLSGGRTVTSATRIGDGIVRLNYTGTCTGGTFTYTPGNLTTTTNIPGQSQPAFTVTTQTIENKCGGGTPTPPPGLHVHYAFDEGTGTNANDETANNLDGTLTGNPAWVAGATGTAVEMAANEGDYVAVPYGSGVDPSTQSMTIALAVLPAASGTYTVFSAPSGTNQRLAIVANNGTWSIAVQSSASAANTEFALTANWQRLCVNFNSATDTATLHVNGVAGTSAQSVKAYTSFALAGNFDIGRASTVVNTIGFAVDDFKLWTSVESCADDFTAWNPNPGGQTATFAQVSYQWYLLRKDTAGNQIKLPSPSSAANSAIRVPSGAVMTLEMQVNESNTANPDPLSFVLQSDLNNSGVFTDVADTLIGNTAFYGNADANTSIPSGAPACPLSGALTCVDGGTQRTAEAVPVVDMGQNNSTVLRYLVQVAGNNNDVIRFRLRNQNLAALNTYTEYATLTISAAYAAAP